MNRHNHRIGRATLSLAAVAVVGALLAACGGGPSDSTAPTVHITSATTNQEATYALTGVAADNVGVTAVTYAVGSGGPQAASLSGGSFSASVALSPGSHTITVIARDAAGNEGNASITVEHEPAPGSLVASREVAAHGEIVSVTGTDFGTSGSADIGGVPAIINSWSDTQVTLTVPGDAPGGPQRLTIHGPHGSSSLDLFVGVDFPEGTLQELAALAVPPATAVRLAARTYEVDGPETTVLFDMSLFGQGEEATVLDLGEDAQLWLFGDVGRDLIVTNLAVTGTVFFVGNAPPSFVGLRAGAALPLELQVMPGGSITIRDATFANPWGGGDFVGESYGDIILQNLTVDAPGTEMYFELGGSLTLQDVTADAQSLSASSAAGRIAFRESLVATVSGFGLYAAQGVDIASSELTATSGVLEIYHNYDVVTTSVYGTRSEVRDSTLNVSGYLAAWFGDDTVAVLAGNVITANTVSLRAGAGVLAATGNRFNVGTDIAVDAWLQLSGLDGHSDITFAGNTATWLKTGRFALAGMGTVLVQDNELAGFGNTGSALYLGQAETDAASHVTVNGNTFTGFGSALEVHLDGPAAPYYEALINGNAFDFPITAAPQVAYVSGAYNATLNATGNTWYDHTDAAAVEELITYVDSHPDMIVFIDPISQP